MAACATLLGHRTVGIFDLGTWAPLTGPGVACGLELALGFQGQGPCSDSAMARCREVAPCQAGPDPTQQLWGLPCLGFPRGAASAFSSVRGASPHMSPQVMASVVAASSHGGAGQNGVGWGPCASSAPMSTARLMLP